MAPEQPKPGTVEAVQTSLGETHEFVGEYLSPNLKKNVADGLRNVETRLITALKSYRERNPDGADKITAAVFAKTEEIGRQLTDRLAGEGDKNKIIAATRGSLIELGTILLQTPPPLEKPGLAEKVKAAFTETAREKNIDALAAAIGNIRVELEASVQPEQAVAQGVKNTSTGLGTLAGAPPAASPPPESPRPHGAAETEKYLASANVTP